MLSPLSILLAGLATALPNVLPRDDPSGLTRVTPEFFTTLERYGLFSAASSRDECPNPPFGSTVLAYLEKRWTDTQATLFRDDTARELVISYRGSTSPQDFLTDFTFIPVDFDRCEGCLVHLGFFAAWKSIKDQSQAAIDAALTETPDYSLVVVGHSLGGALAQLAWADLKLHGYNVTEGWSYGQPRVGNPAFANFIDGLAGATDAQTGTYFRVTNENDGVPLLPPQEFGFRHSRTEFWVSDSENASKNTFRCPGQENPNCIVGQGGFFINEAHVDYPGIDYSTACGTGPIRV